VPRMHHMHRVNRSDSVHHQTVPRVDGAPWILTSHEEGPFRVWYWWKIQRSEAHGSTKAANEPLLDALEALCFQAGIKTERRNIPSVTKRNGKIGRGDLVLMNVYIGGHRHLIIDVALNHEFGGNHMADVTCNGALRAADPAKLLEATARTKIARYREGYANRNGVTYAFLPCVMSTSRRMHGEFLRLLFIIAHLAGRCAGSRTWGDDHHSEDAFKFRRG